MVPSKNFLCTSSLPEQALGSKWENYSSLPFSLLTCRLGSLRINRVKVVEPGPGRAPGTWHAIFPGRRWPRQAGAPEPHKLPGEQTAPAPSIQVPVGRGALEWSGHTGRTARALDAGVPEWKGLENIWMEGAGGP